MKIIMIPAFLLLLFLVFVCVSSIPAVAEWVAVTTSADDTTLYINPETIRRRGQVVEVWIIYDHRLAQKLIGTNAYYASVRHLEQYDCAEERVKLLSSTWFTGNMTKGTTLDHLSRESDWQPIPPDSVGRVVMNSVCDNQ